MVEQNKNEKARNIRRMRMLYAFLLPVLGSLFYFFYIMNASEDVIYTDYIRLVNSYLPNGNGLYDMLVPDILTRIPITYLLRAVNVSFFSYSVTFDRVVGILGFLLTAFVLSQYLVREQIGFLGMTVLFLVMFNLSKWELLINGSGYPHFLSYGLFFYTYLVMERWFTGTGRPGDLGKLFVLPALSLLVAGPYIVQYCMTLLVAYMYLLGIRKRNIDQNMLPYLALSALVPMLLYFWSSSKAVYEHDFVESAGILDVLTKQIGFSVHFILNGFASELVSGAVLDDFLKMGIRYRTIYFLGAVVILLYGMALFLYFKKHLYRHTLMPLLLMISGAGSHVLVFLSRYAFLNEIYAWQSRYSLQYLPGLLGMLLVFAKLLSDWHRHYCEEREKERSLRVGSRKRRRSRVTLAESYVVAVCLIVLLTFAFGSVYTNRRELLVMPFRKQIFCEMRETALQYDNKSDEELNQLFEYHHGPNRVRNALDILRENQLNVYAPRS